MKLDSLVPNAFYDMVVGMPASIYEDNDGSFLFRYNIQPQIGTDEDSGEEKQVGWQCREIRIWERPTKTALKKAIIRSVVDETEELSIINDYYKHVLGIRQDENAVMRYKEFLQFTDDLDSMLTECLL